MSVAIPIPLLQNLPDVNVTPAVGVDEYALCWDNDTARFVLRATTGYDHGLLNGASLADDDHTQYALLAGRAGGQTLYGGTGANDDITIHGTSNATRTTSYVLLQPTAGNVGIGTATPAYQCLVAGVGQATAALTDAGSKIGALYIHDVGGNGGNGGALFFGAATSGGVTPQAAIKSLLTNGGTNGTGDLAFSVRAVTTDVALTERVRILVNGNVGINDTAPAEKLDVNGNINTTGVYKVDDVQVLSNRVIDARADDVANSGDATTDGLIDALRDAMITHGLIAAA